MFIDLKVNSQDKLPLRLPDSLPVPHLATPTRGLEVSGRQGWEAGYPAGGAYQFLAAGGLEAGRRGRRITYTGHARKGA